ncbi:hypothetical protein CXG81DRAFT_27476 [Caulochytrium protostelioides]|uniref:Uncharacterized protein n=1 Tax=Caulochytrium protostelioides TaxID=1555241 RepID=A0A4P9X3Z8_9FUNG|nr:hypothetical protein CXG81DRAFT_27476 [Caulochytrium protostelioides]|eukprot:RKO99776.1 hypothetical protein CXG81DRAFT_27476 [Caulochytrium protostelioides]
MAPMAAPNVVLLADVQDQVRALLSEFPEQTQATLAAWSHRHFRALCASEMHYTLVRAVLQEVAQSPPPPAPRATPLLGHAAEALVEELDRWVAAKGGAMPRLAAALAEHGDAVSPAVQAALRRLQRPPPDPIDAADLYLVHRTFVGPRGGEAFADRRPLQHAPFLRHSLARLYGVHAQPGLPAAQAAQLQALVATAVSVDGSSAAAVAATMDAMDAVRRAAEPIDSSTALEAQWHALFAAGTAQPVCAHVLALYIGQWLQSADLYASELLITDRPTLFMLLDALVATMPEVSPLAFEMAVANLQRRTFDVEEITTEQVIGIRKAFIAPLVHLCHVGYLLPIMAFFADGWRDQTVDLDMLMLFSQQLLSSIELPLPLRVLAAFQPVLACIDPDLMSPAGRILVRCCLASAVLPADPDPTEPGVRPGHTEAVWTRADGDAFILLKERFNSVG